MGKKPRYTTWTTNGKNGKRKIRARRKKNGQLVITSNKPA